MTETNQTIQNSDSPQRIYLWSEVRCGKVNIQPQMVEDDGIVLPMNCLLSTESPRTHQGSPKLVRFDFDFVVAQTINFFQYFLKDDFLEEIDTVIELVRDQWKEQQDGKAEQVQSEVD